MRLNVRDICGQDIISRDAGLKFRKVLLSNWKNKSIEIELGDQVIGSASFFDEAIALLIKREKKSIQEITKKLKFVDITNEDKKILNYVLMARISENEIK
ncbi:MAG: DUF4325 domain-containing protein [Bdellovibrionales bacterium]|nr:DUF4325 domain-containing protein [Bdellovibrionales bacterium]